MTDFEKFATDHTVHNHCSGCGGCMLDPRTKPQLVSQVWCVACFRNIDAKLPATASRPWRGGVVFDGELRSA
jgi:hypothetical protein